MVDGNIKTYLEGRVWQHLENFSLLLGRLVAMSNGGSLKHKPCFEGSFILLEHDVKEVIHTLLALDTLFSWKFIVQGCLHTMETYSNVPLQGLKQCAILNAWFMRTHLTFHQYVIFSWILERHLGSIDDTPSPTIPYIKIYDIFSSFGNLVPDKQVIEVRFIYKVSSLALISKIDLILAFGQHQRQSNQEWGSGIRTQCSSKSRLAYLNLRM